MKTKKRAVSPKPSGEPPIAPIRIYTDGAGARLDGMGSGFAWFRQDSGQKFIQREDRLTNNEAEYKALLSAVSHLPDGAHAEILTDSTLLCGQFNGQFKVKMPALAKLLDEIRQVIAEKRLTVTVAWIPREENLADKLL